MIRLQTCTDAKPAARRCGAALKPLLACALILAVASPAAAQKNKGDAVTDPALADADFAVQGEYAGTIKDEGGKSAKLGVQVIALGDGKFRAVGYRGGLPGDGWDRQEKIADEAEIADGAVHFEKFLNGATLKDQVFTVAGPDGAARATLQRVERKSPTLGKKPPQGAVVLFDNNANDFEPGKTTDEGLLTVPQKSKHIFSKDATLHVEFRTPYKPRARGQGRGNSGAYLQGRYEVQVLDSFGLEGKKNECGGLYGRKDCDLNMCFPPLSWQTYDIDFAVARYDVNGKQVTPPTVTVRHNGVVIHERVELGKGSKNGGPLTLQNHGNPVHYRNIWVTEAASEPAAVQVTEAPASDKPDEAEFRLEEGFTRLDNGKDLTGWTGKLTGWSVVDGAIHLDAKQAKGNIYSEVAHSGDCVVRLEFRAAERADSGLFIHGKQLQVRDYPKAGPKQYAEAAKPAGQWNALELDLTAGVAVIKLNGAVIEKAWKVGGKTSQGLGLQKERGNFDFRRIRVKEKK